MTLIPQFLSALQRLKPVVPVGPFAMMTRVALAVTDTLPGVEGAVVCVFPSRGMRVAVGASDSGALLAEQWEFTVGDGPGLLAHQVNRQVVAGHDFGVRWPICQHALSAAGYRAVRAVPLAGGVGEQPPGLMLLLYAAAGAVQYTCDSDRLDMAQLSLLIGHALTVSNIDLVGLLNPGGADLAHARRRMQVPTAVGMVMTSCHLTGPQAWAVLRGYAYTHDRTIDDTAHALLHGQLPTRALT